MQADRASWVAVADHGDRAFRRQKLFSFVSLSEPRFTKRNVFHETERRF